MDILLYSFVFEKKEQEATIYGCFLLKLQKMYLCIFYLEKVVSFFKLLSMEIS